MRSQALLRHAALLVVIPACAAAGSLLGLAPTLTSSGGSSPRHALQADPPEDATMADALERAAAGSWSRLEIGVECRSDGRWSKVEVFDGGVGFWNGERQFRLAPAQLRSLLEAFREAGFAELRDSYGGATDPRSDDGAPPALLTCRVSLSLDGSTKRVVQLHGGRQSPRLRELADHVLEVCHGPASAGLAAESLEDGLAKIASGALAPRAFRVLLNRRAEAGDAPGADTSWTLRVHGASARLHRYPASGGAAIEVRLDDDDVGRLARLMLEARLADLPVNLYADQYTDVAVRVLDHEKQVQARRFAGMTATTHGQAQRRFDRLLDALHALERRLRDASRSPLPTDRHEPAEQASPPIEGEKDASGPQRHEPEAHASRGVTAARGVATASDPIGGCQADPRTGPAHPRTRPG